MLGNPSLSMMKIWKDRLSLMMMLVVTARINSFIVKRVLVDQGSGAEVMYPNLFKGLSLKNEDLSKYDAPLVGFDGRMVVLEGQISLPIIWNGRR